MDEIVVRTLTLVVKFDSNHPPDWIWECHKNNSFVNGIFITTISEGDQFKNKEDDDN